MTNIRELMMNPLMQRHQLGSPQGPFLRLVLAEAVNYGMPPQLVATLDDLAAMLGFYEPLSSGQAAQVAGPLVQWRTHRFQPDYQSVVDLEALAYKQRALIAFGGAPPGHMVGTAEIVVAMGNVHQGFLEKELGVPGEYHDVFHWASTDVLAVLMGQSKEFVRKEKGWKEIADDEVLKPGGRLHAAYTEIATNIRRVTIASLEAEKDHPRKRLVPIAESFVYSYLVYAREAERRGLNEVVQLVREAVATIRDMYPDMRSDETLLVEFDKKANEPSG